MKRRYLPFLQRRVTVKEVVMGRARELIIKTAIYTNMDSKAGSLLPSYTTNVTGSVTVDDLIKACDSLTKHEPKCEGEDAYCTSNGTVEVVNLAMLELLLYQKQNSMTNTIKTVQKLQAALQQLRQQQVN